MIGKTISHYRIIEELGRGGMGVVYKAQDITLNRQVALKFLPPELERDPRAQERFLHEARAASALDHPNICTIHEISEFKGRHFIAMALVEGENLENKISRGPLAIAESIDIAAQIAAGLKAAHDKGIVHRDIKPANIMVSPDGCVKIMDFGLAKSPGRAQLTREGVTVGTVAYMSPEQARGADADRRSDIWSFGVLLYEMLTGRQPFAGEYEQAVLYSILNSDPVPLGHLRTDVPTGLESIVSRAMDKNRDSRYPDMSRLVTDIADLRESGTGGSRSRAAGRRRRIALIAAPVILAAMAVLLVYTFASRRENRPPPVSRQLTYTGATRDCALSPDGNYVAFVSARSATEEELWVKDLASGSAVKLYTNLLCSNLKWSPDGSAILFNSLYDQNRGGVYLIPRLGGAARQLIDSPWRYTSWSPDGRKIMSVGFIDRTVRILDIQSGAVDSIAFDGIEAEINYPEWSPSGRHVLFQTDDREYQRLWIARIDGTGKVMLHQERRGTTFLIMHPQWAPDGRAVYYLAGEMRGRMIFDLMKIKTGAENGKDAEPPLCVMAGLQTASETGPCGVYSISGDGRKLVYNHQSRHSNIWLVTVAGGKGKYTVAKKRLTGGTTWKSQPAISPDGTTIAFAMSDEKGMNIYSLPLGDPAAEPKQLTFSGSMKDLPVWSPDGREIAFFSNQGTGLRVWKMGADGRLPRPFADSSVLRGGAELSWAPGPVILYQSSGSGLSNLCMLDPVTGEERPLLDHPPAGYIFFPVWSPDNKKIAFFWNKPEEGRQVMRTWILTKADGSLRMLTDDMAIPLTWSPGGDSIYIIKPGRAVYGYRGEIYKMHLESGAMEQYVTLPFEKNLAREYFSMTPDGRKFACSVPEEQSDIWLVENFDPQVK